MMFRNSMKLICIISLLTLPISGASSSFAADFPYRLQRSDLPLTLVATALFATGMIIEADDKAPPLSRSALQAESINPIDRSAIRQWSPGLDRASDIALGGILLAAPSISGMPLLCRRAWPEIATISVMYGEAILLTAGLNGTIKAVSRRNRPYLYNASLSDAEFSRLAEDADSRRSFYSRHTAIAFCSALFLATTTTDIRGRSPFTAATWIGSLGAATAIGITRYASGQHFPTDIAIGAITGSLAGWSVPRLHRHSTKTISAVATGNGLALSWRF
jgi:membrane-associated phospholipid phosphatase